MRTRTTRIGEAVLAMVALGGGWLIFGAGGDDADRAQQPVVVVAAGGDRNAPLAVGGPSPSTPATATATTVPGRDTRLIARVARHATADFRVLSEVVDADARDAASAAPVEAAMTKEFEQVAAIASPDHPVRVCCVATTCEVTGRAGAGRSRAEVEMALQETDLLNRMMGRGYSPGPLAIDATDPERIGFVFYLNREI